MARTFVFGPFRLDERERSLLRDGAPVPLTPRTFDVLCLLLSRSNSLVTKAELLGTVWAGVHVDEAVLARAVSDLRKALTRPGDPAWIETVPKFGYRFSAAVEQTPGRAPAHTAPPAVEDAPPVHPAVPPVSPDPAGKHRLGRWLVIGGAALAFAAGMILPLRRVHSEVSTPARATFILPLPGAAGVSLGGHALSPDGRTVAFASAVSGLDTGIMVRPVDSREPRLIAGTSRGISPFFSPDGRWVGYFDWAGYLKKVSLEDGRISTLCRGQSMRGASWSPEGWIAASLSGESGLSRIPAGGGAPEPLTDPAKSGEVTHRWPQVLPGSHAILFTAHTATTNFEEASIRVLTLRDGTSRTILRRASFARYAPDGRLLFVRDGKLMAQPIDTRGWLLSGEPEVIATGLAGEAAVGYGGFDVSASGSLTHDSTSDAPPMPLAWLERTGRLTLLPAKLAPYSHPRVSPDAKRAVLQAGPSSPSEELTIVDLATGHTEAFRPGRTGVLYASPVWTPDGNHVAFLTENNGYRIQWAQAGSSEEPHTLIEGRFMVPQAFTPDGRTLIYSELGADFSYSLQALKLDAPLGTGRPPSPVGNPQLLLRGAVNAALAPNGDWIAFERLQNGQVDVFVSPFPPGQMPAVQVSREGGMAPKWSRKERSLYYAGRNGTIMRARYRPVDGALSFAAPESFVAGDAAPRNERWQFDLDPASERVLVFAGNPADHGETPLNLIVMLNRFLPGAR